MLLVTGKDGHFCSRAHEESAEVHFKRGPTENLILILFIASKIKMRKRK